MSEEEKKACQDYLVGKNSRIVLDDGCFEPTPGNPPVFVLGFVGTGMVGTIATNELIDQLETKSIGYVLSEDLPPITVFYDGLLKHPFRLYYSEKYNLVLSISEVPFLPGSYTDLARTLMSWAVSIGIKEVVCIQALADQSIIHEGPYPVFVAGDRRLLLDRMKDLQIEAPPKGLIMGAEAAILNECLNDKIAAMILLTTANPQIPCPEGAAAILEIMAKIFGFPIQVDKLLEQSHNIKQDLLELMDQSNKMQGQGLPEAPNPSRDRMLYS